MIQLPKEISKILKTIENSGYEAYTVGGCVRDSLLGKRCKDWDIATNAPFEKILELFPDSEIISKKYGVISIENDEILADIALFRIDGDYVDHRRPDTVTFTDKIEEDLKRRDFTVNAIAINPERGVVDLFEGREDIKRKLIKAVGDPYVRFEEDPLRILRGIRFAARLDFNVDENTLAAMKKKAPLLEQISADRIRKELVKIITSANSTKGLGLLVETGALVAVLGEECTKLASRTEVRDLKILTENIDRAKPDEEYRLGLLYLCFGKLKAHKAIEKLNFDSETKEKLKLAVDHLEDLSFIKNKIDLKSFMARTGREMYLYLDNLSKQQRKVYEMGEFKILSRSAMYDEVKLYKEPVFIEELDINGDDLIKIGMTEGEEIGKMLRMLLDVVHKYPSANKKEYLIKKAKTFRRNPISAMLRSVRWYK